MRALALAALVSAASGLAAAAPPVDATPPRVPLHRALELLVDPSGLLTVDDVTGPAAARFVDHGRDGAPNLGFTDSALWVRFTVVNPAGAPLERWLEIDHAPLDRIELFDGDEVRRAGLQLPRAERELARRTYAFRLVLPPHAERRILLRITSQSDVVVPVALWSYRELAAKDATTTASHGVIYGLLLAMTLSNLFLFVFLRERAHLYYVLAVSSMSLLLLLLDGNIVWLLPPSVGPLSRWIYLAAGGGGSLFMYLFMREFLDIRRSHPRLDQVGKIYFTAGTIVIVTTTIACSWRVLNQVGAALVACNFLFMIAHAILRWRDGFVPARYLALAWGTLTLSTLALLAVVNGVFSTRYEAFILHGGQVGEAVLLSVALADAARRRNLHIARLQEASGRFVPVEFLALLGKNELPEVRHGDQIEREITIFFADIRSFTSTVEGMKPAETIRFVNDLFGRLEPAIAGHGGFIDKFIGDAVMALFERPADAVQASLDCIAAVGRWNQSREQPIAIGIGLHTGPVVLGTVGGERRLSCTVIGDSVNLASRIEGLTKTYGATLLLSESTRAALPEGAFPLRLVDRATVRGRSQPVDLYEVTIPGAGAASHAGEK